MAAPVKTPLTQDEIDRLDQMIRDGIKMDEIGDALGFDKRTLQRRIKDTPGAAKVVRRARIEPTQKVSQTAYQMAVSGEFPAMTMFYLKCRGGWRETQKIEHTGEDGKPIKTDNTITMVVKDYREEP